jgi:WD40 repeat protein
MISALLAFTLCGTGASAHALRVAQDSFIAQIASRKKDSGGEALPAHAVRRLGTIRLRHPGPVIATLFTLDGKALVTLDAWHQTPTLWNRKTGAPLGPLTDLGHSPVDFAPQAIVLSPDGNYLCAGGLQQLVFWNVHTGAISLRWQPQPFSSFQVRALAYSPKGPNLAVAFSRTLQGHFVAIWDTEKHAISREWRVSAREIKALAYSPDGNVLAGAVSDGTSYLWNAADGKELHRFVSAESSFLRKAHNAVAFSARGDLLAYGGDDAVVHLWDIKKSTEVGTLAAPEGGVWRRLTSLAFSPDGRRLVAGYGFDGNVKLWDVASQKCAWDRPAHPAGVRCVAFSPNGKVIASGGNDHTARLWEAATGADLCPSVGHEGPITSLDVSNDGRVVSCSRSPTVLVWSLQKGTLLHRWPQRDKVLYSAAFTARGKSLVLAGDTDLLPESRPNVRLVDAATGKELRALLEQPAVRSSAISADGKTLAVGYGIRTVGVLDVATGNLHYELQAPSNVDALAFTPDGSRLVSRSKNGGIVVWNTAKRKAEHFLTKPGVGPASASLSVSPDGKLLAGCEGADAMPYLWDLKTGAQVRNLGVRGTHCFAFSRRGELLAAGSNTGRITFWIVKTGQKVAQVDGHAGKVTCLAFSADDRYLVSGGDDTSLLVWDVAAVIGGKSRPNRRQR